MPRILAIWLIAFALRVIYVLQIRYSPFFDVLLGDARSYDAWAQRIAAGDWLGQGVFYQAPLYPYFLGTIYSIAGRSLLLVRIIQAAIGASSCAVLALAVRRLSSDKVGLIAGLMLAIYAPAIFFDGLLQKSVLDLFFVSILLWVLAGLIEDPGSRRRWFAAGATLGLLALTRENALIFIAPIALWWWFRADTSDSRAKFATIAAFVCGLFVVLSPVAARNRIAGGEWHITTSQSGPNFYLGNNPSADGTATALAEGRGSAEYERDDATNLAQASAGRPLTPSEVSAYWWAKGFDFIRTNPAAWLKLEARKAVLLLNAEELVDTESQDSYEDWSSLLKAIAWVGQFGVLMPLAAIGVIARWRDRQRLWLYEAMAMAYGVSVLAFYVSARYRLPLVPLLMVFAAMGVESILQLAAPFNVMKMARSIAVVIAVAVISNWRLWPPNFMRAVTENNLANALQTDGRYAEAGVHYRRALELRPDYAPAYVNLGEALAALGEPDTAVDAYKRAAALGVLDVDLNARIGNAYLRAGRSAEAIEYFQKSIAGGAASKEVYGNLVSALLAGHRDNDAITALKMATAHNPADGLLHFRLGALLVQHADIQEAIGEFRAGLALSPNSPEGHDALGAALAESGHLEEAIVEFEKALSLNPELMSARRNLETARQDRMSGMRGDGRGARGKAPRP